jgi:protein tyrosine phosphatase (PTP) superfamily phosphohydrolase (DUF442 family)
LLFLNQGAVVKQAQGKVIASHERFTFGPYPDRLDLQTLKEQGYDGVITLLHPSIPFERVLLTEERENAEDVGIELHSLPMLPWISDNHEALAEIRKLAAESEKRYYIHCYLGKHRADVAIQAAALAAGETIAQPQAEPLPDKLERGPLLAYREGQVIVGPFPTEEEWFAAILRAGVQEVVSVMDPVNPDYDRWNEQLRAAAADLGIRTASIPLASSAPDKDGVARIVSYLEESEHKVFVVGFHLGNWTWALDHALGGAVNFPVETFTKEQFERGPVGRSHERLLYGPLPTDEEMSALNAAKVKVFISLLDGNNPDNDGWIRLGEERAALYGLEYYAFSVSESDSAEAIRDVAEQIQPLLQDPNRTLYAYRFRSDEILNRIIDILSSYQGEPS